MEETSDEEDADARTPNERDALWEWHIRQRLPACPEEDTPEWGERRRLAFEARKSQRFYSRQRARIMGDETFPYGQLSDSS